MDIRAPRVAGAGICCVDYIVVAPQVSWGDTALVKQIMVQGGGLVGTALVACARLGAECDLLSLLGDDQVGDQIITDLEGEGIPCGHVVRIPGGRSPFSFIHVDERSGERTIFHRAGEELARSARDLESIIVADWDALLVDDIYLDVSISAAKAARGRGIPVVADLVPDQCNSDLATLVDVLIAPKHYARRIGCEDDLDAALDAMHALGPVTAVITLGNEGWVYSDKSGRGRGSSFRVDVLDTTGAGDAFHGAYTFGLARGWDTERCCEFASAVAAIKCTKEGGRSGLPRFDEVVEFLERH